MPGENMKKIIYSIYFPIEKHVPFKGTTEKSENRTKELNRNANELIYRQRIYAMSIGAEYKLFGKTDFDEFKEMTTEYDFDKLGFFKLYLLKQLSKTYDRILYLDLDVIPNTSLNFFNVHEPGKLHVLMENCDFDLTLSEEDRPKIYRADPKKKPIATKPEIVSYYDRQHRFVKSMAKQMMNVLTGVNSSEMLANTGIIGADKKCLEDFNIIDDMKELTVTYNKVKEEKMADMLYPGITDKFFINNEVFFTHYLEKKKIEYRSLDRDWHFHLMNKDNMDKITDWSYPKLIHLINKRFEKLWKKI